jgi:hypothetical protein
MEDQSENILNQIASNILWFLKKYNKKDLKENLRKK